MISSFKLAVIHVNSFYHTRNEALYLFERGPVDHVLLPRHDEMQIVDNGATVGHCSVFMGCLHSHWGSCLHGHDGISTIFSRCVDPALFFS